MLLTLNFDSLFSSTPRTESFISKFKMFSIYEDNISINNDEVKFHKRCLTKKMRLDLILIKAVEKGRVCYLESLFKNGVETNEKKVNGWALIHTAVSSNQVKVVNLLIQHGANVNVQATDKVSGLDNLETPLHLATFIGNDEIAKLLSRNGAKVDVSVEGVTPFHMAVINNDLEIVNMILEKTNNVDPQDENGFTPLHRAIWNRKVEVAKLLISKGANIEAVAKQDLRPIHVAILCGSLELMEILIKNGATVDAQVSIGSTNRHIDTTVQPPSKVKSKRSLKLTPLHLTVSLSSMRGLFKVGSKIESVWSSMIKGSKKQNCSYEVLEKVRIKMVQLLLKSHAAKIVTDAKRTVLASKLTISKKLEEVTDLKQTPLLLAAKNGFFEIGKLLIQLGANVNVKDHYEYTPLHHSIMFNQIEFAKLLLNNGSHVENPRSGHQPIHSAVWAKYLEATKLLIDHGANVNLKDFRNNSPIYYAVKRNAIDMVKLLLENGAVVEDNEEDKTLLTWAIDEGHIEIAKVLITNGVNVNTKDLKGNCPIHYAAKRNSIDVVKLLIENGASIHDKSDEGVTPFDLAINKGKDIEFIEFLIAKGAHVNAIRNGYAPIHRAVEQSNVALTKSLIDNYADISIKTDREYYIGEQLTPLQLGIALGDPWKIDNNFILRNAAVLGGYLKGHLRDSLTNEVDFNSINSLNSDMKEQINVRNEEIIKTLIYHGADVNAKTIADGFLPLHFAMLLERKHVQQMLLDTGKIDVNFKTQNNETLLMFAFRYGLTQSIPILIDYGASLTLRNNDKEDHKEFLMANVDISKLKQVLTLEQNI